MSKTTHTPGPWTVGPRGASVYRPNGMRIAALDAHADSLGLRAADARLMAAAPELLEACREAIKALNNYSTEPVPLSVYNRVSRLIVDAIAKAEGPARD